MNRSDPASRRAGTAAALIHRELRAEILAVTRLPGAALNEAEIAGAYGVSRTPAREAILRLADEGLIDIFPQAGTFVAAIPIDELPETIALRRALEEAVAREAALRADPGAMATLRHEIALQRADEAAGDHAAFHQADERFHASLAAIAARPRFWAVVLQNKLQVDRFRRLTLPQPGRMAAAIREHAAIVEAVAAGDPDAAAAAMGRHLDALLRTVEALRTERNRSDPVPGPARTVPEGPPGDREPP